MKLISRKHTLFYFIVLLPTLFTSIYYTFIASDIYISESHFVVRSPDQATASPLGMIFKGAGIASSQNDFYAVHDYILSRDALLVLIEQIDLKEAFSNADIDRLSRFPLLTWNNNFEHFYLYYLNKLTIDIDASSSISTLRTRAFSPELAYEMNLSLLKMSENLINHLNNRIGQDMINFSLHEVTVAQANAQKAALSLAGYRNDKGVINPEQQSAIPFEQVARLQQELIATKVQIFQLERIAKNNPQLPAMRHSVKLLEDEIKIAMLRIVGKGDSSLASKAAEYRRLELEKEFADTMLAGSMSALEQSRGEAQRKQLYLERIVQPNLPDQAMEPRRLRIIVSVLILSLITWGILAMLIAGIKEHQD